MDVFWVHVLDVLKTCLRTFSVQVRYVPAGRVQLLCEPNISRPIEMFSDARTQWFTACLCFNSKATTIKMYTCSVTFLCQSRRKSQSLFGPPCWKTGSGFLMAHYRQVSSIRRTLVGNKIDGHSDVVGAAPTGYIFILDLTPGFIGLKKDNCKTRRETFKFGDLVRLILEILR